LPPVIGLPKIAYNNDILNVQFSQSYIPEVPPLEEKVLKIDVASSF